MLTKENFETVSNKLQYTWEYSDDPKLVIEISKKSEEILKLEKFKKKTKKVPIDEQAKIDKRLGKSCKKGLEVLTRKKLNVVARKHKIKTFQKKNVDIIKELREVAITLPSV
jgi:hypothetical protein